MVKKRAQSCIQAIFSLGKMVGRGNHINFTEAIEYFFYVTKCFGLIPYSISQYRQHKVMVSSVFGNIQTIVSLIACVFFYDYAIIQTYFDGKSFDSGKNLYRNYFYFSLENFE